jgi:3-oxoadipate enol-lactonase
MAASAPSPRPLVLLHGLGQSPIAWQDVVTDIGAGRPLLAPWMVGLKPSDAGAFDVSTAAYALADQLELEGVTLANVCGSSVGALVALRMALDTPERVGALILVEGLVRPSRVAMALQAATMRMIPRAKYVEAGASKERMLSVLEAIRRVDLAGDLPRVSVPTLVVCGALDKANLPASRVLAERIPGARLELIDGAGAGIVTGQPKALAELVTAFLAEVESS